MGYDPQTATVNALSEIGYKIFLDRYAVKDGTKSSLKVGDTVVVCTNLETRQTEVGVVTAIKKSEVTVKLRADGSEVTRAIEHVDKPIETDPSQMQKRVARGIAAVEKTPAKRKLWQREFERALKDWKFVPAGRILTGAGSDQALTYYNCYVIPSPQDSRGGILDSLRQMAEIMSRGGGVGMNLSSLRPRYDYVKGVNGRSSGSVSWGSLYSFVTGLIEQGGSRRGALMLILNVWHPDVDEFITSKTNMGKITNANISVGVTDDFMAAVDADGDWDLVFPDRSHPDYDTKWDGDLASWKKAGRPVKVYKTVRARELWEKIIDSAWASAEPGLFFIDRANHFSNSHYFASLISTNPCGEQPLPGWAVCNLGAINLAKFTAPGFTANQAHTVEEALAGVLWDDLRTTIHTAVRFLDNVIDATPYFFEENRDQQKSERRVGLNTMGIAEMMINLGQRYGSEDGNAFVDRLYQFIASETYTASSALAKEKGSFPKFNASKFLQSGYMQAMPDGIRSLVKKQGMRNVTVLTQAPNGTIGTMVGTSTGIEPFYYWTYQRRSRLGMHEERVGVYEQWLAAHPNEEKPTYFVTAMDLAPEDHIGVQAVIQRWVDSAISKTCNVPNDYTREQVGDLYKLMHKLNCKGGTVYRDGSRDVQVLDHKAPASDDTVLAKQGQSAAALATAVGIAPRKRPEVMRGTTYKVPTAYGNMYLTINDDEQTHPFELFITLGKTGGFFAAKTEAISRLASLALRSGVKIEEIIDELKGIRGPSPMWTEYGMILSVPDAISQVLTRHIQRGQEKLDLKFAEDGTPAPTEGPATLAAAATTSSINTVAMSAEAQAHHATVDTVGEVGQGTATATVTKTKLADLGVAPACPACGGNLLLREGCMDCPSCGYSKCT
ncbi:adenosylcobalamin-dependent ribonucleoside-diphosphate reductase [Candidatus Berkelbacteria bacterium]|nr:adenosylcobalamin-dependent ribonucleoside-diphosphate reductase [Candidatus Berkelbacteria bacterium]